MNVDYDNYKPKRPVEGDSILIITISKSIKMFDYNETYRFTQEHYIDWLTKEIRKHTDKRIIVRQT